jgi:uncharacterized protein YndB with AHSA1/START domain
MTINIDTSSVDAAVIIMRRTFDAPRDVVWQAFTDPKHVAKWYGGHGFTNPVCEMDVRPGGRWRHTMLTPDGVEYPMEFVYLEVVKPEKLVWQHVDYGKRDGGPPTCINTVTLEDDGKQTKWKLVARFNSFAEREMALKMEFAEMISQGCERFNDVVKAM